MIKNTLSSYKAFTWHALVLLYLALFSLFGISYMFDPTSRVANHPELLICYGLSLVAGYGLVYSAARWLGLAGGGLAAYAFPPLGRWAIWLVHGMMALFPILYFADLGYVPVLRFWAADEYYAASNMRHINYYRLSTFYRYMGEYYARGFLPVWVVFCYLYQPRRVFYAVLGIAVVFCINQLTKTPIVVLLLPLVIIQLSKRHFFMVALSMVVIFSAMYSIQVPTTLYMTSAEKTVYAPAEYDTAAIQEKYTKLKAQESEFSSQAQYALYKYAEALMLRLSTAQGRVLNFWLAYTDTHPLLKGCGYRWIAKIKGCDYVDMGTVLWNDYYDATDKRGALGSISAADYINAYGNFGLVGVVVSALVLAALLTGLSSVYASPLYLFAFNCTFTLLVLESQVTTLMNSGGWAVGVLAYLLILHPYAMAEKSSS